MSVQEINELYALYAQKMQEALEILEEIQEKSELLNEVKESNDTYEAIEAGVDFDDEEEEVPPQPKIKSRVLSDLVTILYKNTKTNREFKKSYEGEFEIVFLDNGNVCVGYLHEQKNFNLDGAEIVRLYKFRQINKAEKPHKKEIKH